MSWIPISIQRLLAPDLDKRIFELSEEVKAVKTELVFYKNLVEDANNAVTELVKQIEELKEVEEPMRPVWLDKVNIYNPKISNESTGDITELADPREIYTVSSNLKSIATDIKKKYPNIDERLKIIWAFVINRIKYVFDKNENWQFPQHTYYRGVGDCEDGTILFIDLCRMAGIPSDTVFNACGWYYSGSEKFGHSFPIAKKTDGLWYIYETTIDNVPSEPKLFKDSNYDASWGLSNWFYYGKIKKESNVGGEKWQV